MEKEKLIHNGMNYTHTYIHILNNYKIVLVSRKSRKTIIYLDILCHEI